MITVDVANPLRRNVRTERTRQAIRAAALKIFSGQGYAEAGIRDIAALAKVNPGLVTRYFGSKLGLFEAVLGDNLDSRMFTDVERELFGERLAAAFCDVHPEAASVIPMLIFAAGDRLARDAALKMLMQHVILPLEEWFGAKEAAERTAQLMLVVTGFFTYRLMLPLEPLKGRPTDAMREWLARTLQEIVDR